MELIFFIPLAVLIFTFVSLQKGNKTVILKKFGHKYMFLWYTSLILPFVVLFTYALYIERNNYMLLQNITGNNTILALLLFVIVYLSLQVIIQFLLLLCLRVKKV